MTYEKQPHRWDRRPGIPWEVCRCCGLVALKNPLTRWCIQMGCNHDEHPDYQRQIKLPRQPL